MDHNIVTGVVNALPIDKMVSAPLVAAIKAQSDMSLSLAHFVQDVGLDENGNVRMVTFKYNEEVTNDQGKTESKDRYIQAPFIALTGVPNLAVEDVNISFDLEVSTAEDTKQNNKADSTVTSEYKSWWSPVSAKFTGSVTHSSEQTRHTDTRAKYSFSVSARKQGPPEGLMRIIDAVTAAVANPSETAKSTKLIDDGSGGGGGSGSGGGGSGSGGGSGGSGGGGGGSSGGGS